MCMVHAKIYTSTSVKHLCDDCASLSAIPVNSLWPSDAIWRQRSGTTLAQVMACCLTAPSHYLNHCWLIISKVEWHSSKGNFTRDTSAIYHWNYLKNQVPKMSLKFPRGQWVKQICMYIEDVNKWQISKCIFLSSIKFLSQNIHF